MDGKMGSFYEFGTLADTFRLDVKKRRLAHNGKEITVTPKVLDVLLLLQNSGNVLEKGRLMKALWPESFVEEGNLNQNIFVLRKILGDDGNSNRFIQTIPRRGDKFLAQ
jgi:DNA-binding winged helix-turn-helix (wHTH) protein